MGVPGPTEFIILLILFILFVLIEAVMNSIRTGLRMRKTRNREASGQPENPHWNAESAQVHNTL